MINIARLPGDMDLTTMMINIPQLPASQLLLHLRPNYIHSTSNDIHTDGPGARPLGLGLDIQKIC